MTGRAVAWVAGWSSLWVGWWLLAVLLAGCGVWTIRLETTAPPDEVRWQGEITGAINDHAHRIATLEATHATPTPIGGNP